ncbi:MAG: methionine--tRNA ligase [Proteobacteria bacterium]|nr:methionine--tRNA ligase [Pseudomonadota bacterium]
MRRILVTSALPYANGPLHFGHILEAVQTDIWARSLRLAGHECIYVCADDTHGTPMMLKAQAEGVTPEELIAGVEAEHRSTYRDFMVEHAQFHSTHSAENREMTEKIYLTLEKAGYIAKRTIRQAYDAQAQMFLPDRYVKGTCPRCAAKDQYGDSCESCGATYTPSELIDAVSVVSGTPPVERDSEHLFFRLDAFEAMLREWTRSGALHPSVANKLDEWFNAGLRDWDISRDAPYFGFEIPGHPGKYFYVWLDAPIGYMGASLALARREGLDFDAWWGAASTAELHHFIGKDILYFHTLFWPAVLTGAGYRRPTQVHAHGFLTVNGQKMSKSRGTFITGRRYLDRLPPEALRYYFAAKLDAGIDDMDLSLDDFVNRFNSDVVGKLVNIASRCAGFIARGGGTLAAQLPEPALYEEFSTQRARIAALYEARDFATAIREIAALADRANQYIDAQKPWNLAKDPARAADVSAVCTQGINLFRVLITYLAPVLPAMAENAGRFLGQPIRHWDDVAAPLLGTTLATYEPLATRLDPKVVATLIEPDADAAAAPAPAPAKAAATKAAIPAAAATPSAAAAEITVDEFARIELRVARVVAAEYVEGADKLLKLTVDVGTEQRTVFAGIRSAYTPEQLVDRHVLVVANLKPRKMRFGLSQGMVLAASGDGTGVFLVAPDSGAVAGMRVQ